VISDGVISLIVIAGGVVFITFAQLARRRAVAQRGGSLRTSTGLPQLVPYFFWVPYAVVGLRLGPKITLDESLRLGGAALSVGGVALSAVGIVFSIWSIVTLGRHYDLVLEVHAGHQLVRGGPFAWVRHPVYTGLALHFLGACLATGNVLLLIGTLFVTLPAFYARARAEETLLREQFGSEYDRYMDEVPMLVPGLRVRGGKK
jgi:protein-S-isoprenylcysteine O-methyltransferase Ste14